MDLSKMKFLERDIIPCWYEMNWIGWNGEEPAILLRLHKDFVQNTKPIPEEAPIIRQFKAESFNTLFDTFVGEFNKESFGFNQALRHQGEKGDFLEYLVPIPEIDKLTGRRCPECGGSRKDQFLEDSQCLFCHGTGKEREIDWHTANSIVASLDVLLSLAQFPESETSCSLPQLLTFHTSIKPYSLGGVYGIILVKYLISFGQHTKIQSMVHAMKTTWQKMMQKRDWDECDFLAQVADNRGWLNVNIPGQACGLNPSPSTWLQENRGYRFSDHNLDSPMQLITLVAGLSALYEKARHDIALNPKQYT